MKNKYYEMAQVFKALCDENRIHIIEMLQSGEMCAANILEELEVTQPTLSHHMKTLCESGIVEYRKSGKWMYYRISQKMLFNVQKWLRTLAEAEGVETEPLTLEQVAANRTRDLLAPRKPKKAAASAPKKKPVSSKPAKPVLPQTEEKEVPKRRDVDIVIL